MNMTSLTPFTRGATRPTGIADPRDPFTALHRDVNQLFDEALRNFGMPVAGRDIPTGIWPSIEVSEHDGEVRVSAEVPGLEPNDIELTVENDALVLRGEKRAETEDANRRVSERFHGRFERRIPVGFEVDQDQVKAAFRNGVLTVSVPKPATLSGGGKRIEIADQG